MHNDNDALDPVSHDQIPGAAEQDETPDGAPVLWLRDALAHLFDVDFLRRHMLLTPASLKAQSADPRALQETIANAIESLRPPATVSLRSEPWRLHQILDLRYVRGLSQVEAADQIGLSVRQFRREQNRAVRALASALFADAMTTPPPAVAAQKQDASTTQRISAAQLIRGALDTITPLLQRDRIEATIDIADGAPMLQTDPMVARQFVLNALLWLTNGRTGGVISAKLAPADVGQLDVVLTYTGATPQATGLASDDGRADAGRNIKTLAEMLGAPIELSDDDAGARLQLRLPAGATATVLVVDDNADAIELARRFLGPHAEYRVAGALTPEDALTQAAALRPAAILLDVMLPGRDGWEVLTLLKARPDTANIPVIISSVLEQTELSQLLGAAGVLRKPYDAEQLLSTLSQVIATGA
jgi:CheY-like chemotaxis protein/DNA-directed RNA polymerase specialized sigma24 family protein